MRKIAVVAAVFAATSILGAAPAVADPPPPGCERVPILGLDPKVREICDLPIQPDGSWTRWRWYWAPRYVGSQCVAGFPADGQLANGCPPGTHHSFSPEYVEPKEVYVVTADTIPPGEPGYIGG
ncbi:hypothetical protein AB0876_28605 [Mycobacterium sp. NPDC049093]